MSIRPQARILAAVLTAAAIGTLSACGGAAAANGQPTGAAAATARPAAAKAAPVSVASTTPALPQQLPNLGPKTLAEVPANAEQVVEVVGKGKNSSTSSVVIYEHTDGGWQAGATWAAHNAKDGWSADHHEGDLHSPIGVFTLTDAGGRLADPGTKLPYDQSASFTIGGTGFEGEPLKGSFDYVVAINYNRRTGVTPLDNTRPLGESKGGGIWFHVDHGGPTHGCVSITKANMKTLLQTLDPAQHPVVVMGDAASLAD